MIARIFAAFTSEPQDGCFLIIGHNIEHDVQIAFLIEDIHRDAIKWGDVLQVEFTSKGQRIEGDYFPLVDFHHIEEQKPNREKAAQYQDSANSFMKQMGWEEEALDRELGDVIDELQSCFSIFPEPDAE